MRLASVFPGWTPHVRTPLVGVLPGEGVGPEVMAAAVAVLQAVVPDAEIRRGGAIGGEALRAHGAALTPAVAEWCADLFEQRGAVLCGPGGHRFVYDLRARFDLYCKLTPVEPTPALRDAGVVRPERLVGVNLIVVRENVGGLYFGRSGRENGTARQSFDYRDEDVRRTLRVAVALARRRSNRIALVVKPGAMPSASELWSERFQEVTGDLEARILEVDNATYQVVADPTAFDVIVAPNLFGDVVSDCASLLIGSRGMSYSGNFSEAGVAVYQTGHGCAHDIAGRGVANPIGQIHSLAMLLRESFGLSAEAQRVGIAIEHVLDAGVRTADIAAPGSTIVGTEEMGRRIVEAIGQAS